MSKRTDSHCISHAESIFSGDASIAGGGRGIPRASFVQVSLGAPVLLDANGLVTGETLGAAGDFTFDGALWTTPATSVTLDVPRGVQIVNAGASVSVITFYGTDKYGVPMQESITSDGATPVFGLKAFKTITRIASDSDTTGNVTIGTSDILGLPFRLENVADILVINENNVNVYDSAAQTAAAAGAATALATEAQVSASVTQTMVATEALTAAALTENSGQTTPNTTIVDVTGGVTDNSGSGLDAGAKTEIDALFVLVDDNFADIADQLNKQTVDSADQRVAIEQAVVDLADYKTNVDALVVESTDYKATIDALIVDLAALVVQFDKVVLDAAAVDTGTLVKADATATATATTGDVRGTYNPTAVLDGTKVFKMTYKPKGRNTRGAYGSVQYRA